MALHTSTDQVNCIIKLIQSTTTNRYLSPQPIITHIQVPQILQFVEILWKSPINPLWFKYNVCNFTGNSTSDKLNWNMFLEKSTCSTVLFFPNRNDTSPSSMLFLSCIIQNWESTQPVGIVPESWLWERYRYSRLGGKFPHGGNRTHESVSVKA